MSEVFDQNVNPEDDPVMPEDLYFHDITAKIKLKDDDVDEIEDLEVVAPPPPRRDIPQLDTNHHTVQHSDPADTLYGANTNTYTTDDNTSYPNPALIMNPHAALAKQEALGTCGGSDDEDMCGCGENTKAGCGGGDCEEPSDAKAMQKQGGCGDDCGCEGEKKDTTPSGNCGGDSCGCSSSPKGVNNTNNNKNNNNPIPTDLKPSTNGLEYDITTGDGQATNIPGVGVVYIKTWGCSHNTSDGEYMAGLLQQAGYTITNDDNKAQIAILNSCSVKNPSETSLLNALEYYKKQRGLGVVVAGCVPQAHPSHPMLATYSGKAKALSQKKLKKLQHKKMTLDAQRDELIAGGKTAAEVDAFIKQELEQYKQGLMKQQKKETQQSLDKLNTAVFKRDGSTHTIATASITYDSDDEEVINSDVPPYAGVVSVLGTDNIHRVVEVVDSTLQGHSMSLLTNTIRHRPANHLALPKIRKNPFVEIISISTGCLNHCTYCKTKAARGALRSYPIEEIVERVKSSLEEGVIEIWLTSEDLGAYGIDLGVRVPALVNAILDVMTPGTMLRMGMSNPPYFKDILDPMYKIFHHPQCYEFLHIPVQAGADTVLNDMKRDYTNYEFQLICDALLENVPNITLATDFICGFPTETDKDWEESVKLLEKYKFPVTFINQFYPRPGTPAYDMPQLPAVVLKGRSKELVTLFNSYNTRKDRVGEICEVLVTDMSRDEQFMVAHTKQYDQVLIPCHPKIMGKKVKVKIIQCEKHYLISELLPGSVEAANSTPTTLPVNYKYWSFAQHIESNLDSFVAPTISQKVIQQQPIGGVLVEPKAKSTTNKSSIDDEEDLSQMTKRKVTQQQKTAEAPVAVPPPPQQQPEAPKSKLIPLTQNKSHLATQLVTDIIHSFDDLEKLDDETVLEYAKRSVRGDVVTDVIEPDDLDPKKQVAVGIIAILILILLWRRLEDL